MPVFFQLSGACFIFSFFIFCMPYWMLLLRMPTHLQNLRCSCRDIMWSSWKPRSIFSGMCMLVWISICGNQGPAPWVAKFGNFGSTWQKSAEKGYKVFRPQQRVLVDKYNAIVSLWRRVSTRLSFFFFFVRCSCFQPVFFTVPWVACRFQPSLGSWTLVMRWGFCISSRTRRKGIIYIYIYIFNPPWLRMCFVWFSQ